MKKFTVLLIMALLISAGLLADGTKPIGDGSEFNPYQVATLDNLLWISTNTLTGFTYIIQTADIDATDTENWNDGEGFNPIGGELVSFVGYYNGDGHSIFNLFITRHTSEYQGLFGKISGSTIENLTLENFHIVGLKYVGGLAGYCYGSTIINCASENIFVRGNHRVGGLIGEMYEYSGSRGSSSILFSHSTGTIDGYGDYCAGLVGCNDNTLIKNCFTNMESVTGDNFVGGLVGRNRHGSIITNCRSIAEINGEEFVGGLVGENAYASTISECYSMGNIIADTRVGGLVGRNIYNANISNCYSTANVVCNVSYGGGFVGLTTTDCTISNCYSVGLVFGIWAGGFGGGCTSDCENNFWDIETSGRSDGLYAGINLNITGKAHEEMLNVSTFTDTTTVGLYLSWDFVGNPFNDNENEDIWDIDGITNNGYPFLVDSVITFVDEVTTELLRMSLLKDNYPNPFNSTTTISFSLQEKSMVCLAIFNFKGQKIRTLTNKHYSKGNHSVIWNGKDDNNLSVSPGLYFYKLNVNLKSISVKKCLFLN